MYCRGLHNFLIGLGGIFYSKYNKEPPKPYSNYSGPYIRELAGAAIVDGVPLDSDAEQQCLSGSLLGFRGLGVRF